MIDFLISEGLKYIFIILIFYILIRIYQSSFKKFIENDKVGISLKRLWNSKIFDQIYKRGLIIMTIAFLIVAYSEITYMQNARVCYDYLIFVNYNPSVQIPDGKGGFIYFGGAEFMKNITPQEANMILINASQYINFTEIYGGD